MGFSCTANWFKIFHFLSIMHLTQLSPTFFRGSLRWTLLGRVELSNAGWTSSPSTELIIPYTNK